eukprot:3654120-Amphidinium_carterae.1
MDHPQSEQAQPDRRACDDSKYFVRAENRIAELVAQLVVLCDLRGHYFAIEQPGSSLFYKHPAIEASLKIVRCRVHQVRFSMASYEAELKKPTVLVGNAPWLPVLKENDIRKGSR